MDNIRAWEAQVANDELPFEEAIVRLLELRDRYDSGTSAALAGSACGRHLALFGHRLTFGCCSDEQRTQRLLAAEAEELLVGAEREQGYVRPDFK